MQFFNECKNKTEAKATFRKLSKCFHPDKDGGEHELMIELKKQFEAFNPDKKQPTQEQENPYAKFTFDPNPRVQILERELARLRNNNTVPTLERNLNYAKEKASFFEKENTILSIKYSALERNAEKLEREIKELNQNKIEFINTTEHLREQLITLKDEMNIEKEEQELSLWQKIKYVMGDKSVKPYN